MPFLRIIFVLCLGSFPVFAKEKDALNYQNKYYVACYYQDTDPTLQNNNAALIKKNLPGALNYFWAKNKEGFSKLELTGKIRDGFFIEEKLTYADVIESCNQSIKTGYISFLGFLFSPFFKTKSTYGLYAFKASVGNFSLFEYPIVFVNPAKENENQKIDRFVVFGDSLSDNGNLIRWTKIIPFSPYWLGRFSNGPVWAEYVSFFTGWPELNFAYGGAKSGEKNDIILDSIPSDLQDDIGIEERAFISSDTNHFVNKYLENYLTKDSYETVNKKISDANRTLFVLWIGANDFIEKMFSEKMLKTFFEKPEEEGGSTYIYKNLIKNIVAQIKNLYEHGATNFLVMNLPNSSRTPLIFSLDYKFSDEPKENLLLTRNKIKEIIDKYNFELKLALDNVSLDLKNKVKIGFIDMDKNFYNMLASIDADNSEKTFDYNFESFNSTIPLDEKSTHTIPKACYLLSYEKAYFVLGTEALNHFALANQCRHKDNTAMRRSFFWDNPHPSSYTHCFLAYFVMKSINKEGFASVSLPSLDEYKRKCTLFVEQNFARIEDFKHL